MKRWVWGIFFWCTSVWPGVSAYVASDSLFYDVTDSLESYGCAYATYRLFRPQTHEDLRSAVYAEGAEQCKAPEWLLLERQVMFLPRTPSSAVAQVYSFADEETLALQGIESSVTPLYPLRQNRPALAGTNLNLELALNLESGAAEYGLALSATPAWKGSLVNHKNFVGDFYFQQGYIKGGYKWLELVVGRLALGFGGAKHGTLLLSQAAQPYNLVLLGLRPHVVGTPLSFLGPLTFQTFVADLGDSSFVSGARLWGLHLGFRPSKHFSSGILILNQFGGGNTPSLEFSDYLKMAIYSGESGLDGKRHRAFGWHNDIWLFNYVLKLYTQIYFESLNDISTWLADDLNTLAGVWFPRLGEADLRVEYVRTVPGAYVDSTWGQGLTHRGSPIGHPLGQDALGVYVDLGLPAFAKSWKPTLHFAYERRFLHPTPGVATEQRIVGGVGVRKRWERTVLGLSSRYASVENPLYIPGQSNNLFSVYAFLEYGLF